MGPFGIFYAGRWREYIAKKRAVPVAGRYAMIGRTIAYCDFDRAQRMKLTAALAPYVDPVVVTAMRYWKPFTEDAWLR